jgi:hypothetical protein
MVSLEECAVKVAGEVIRKPVSVHFVLPNSDGDRFDRCLNQLRLGDIIEVKFLPFLPKEVS